MGVETFGAWSININKIKIIILLHLETTFEEEFALWTVFSANFVATVWVIAGGGFIADFCGELEGWTCLTTGSGIIGWILIGWVCFLEYWISPVI